jgi:hypothetical protein
MKKFLTPILLLSLLLGFGAGCKKDKETTCSLATAVNRPPVAMNVTYVATATGDGVISTLSYIDGSGLVTVSNPTLPWTTTVSVPADADVRITASGTVKNGSLKVEYAGMSGGVTISGSDMCSHETD